MPIGEDVRCQRILFDIPQRQKLQGEHKAMYKTRTNSLLLASAISSLLVVGCDSGSGGGGTSADPNSLSATLVAPVQVSANPSEEFGSMLQFHARMSECANVPAGYTPLMNVTVVFLDAAGNELSSTPVMTDECGFFSSVTPAGTASIRVVSAGNRDLVASVDAIAASGFVASTIPSNADYRIGFLSAYDDTTLGFTVTDTITNKAVVGLSSSTFSVSLDGTDQSFTSITTGLTGDDASIVMVTDASGSMGSTAFTDDTGFRYSRNNLSAIAAHQFLDQKGQNDEISMLIFDGRINFMDQQAVNDLFTMQDASANPFNYVFPANGFTKDSAQMRLIVDAYNRDSKLWDEFNDFDNHPDTPAISMTDFYPWGGSTAFYRSTVEASNKLLAQGSPRKFILAMTDGSNNGGGSIQEVIDTANTNRTPVYTIGFADPNRTDLDQIATDTGATYFQAESLDISDAYNSIQTNIQFQYIGTLATSTATTSQIVLSFDVDGDGAAEATRTIVNTPPTSP